VPPPHGGAPAAHPPHHSPTRQQSLELARFGITANALRAGVTDTPALRKIPGAEQMIDEARRQNPYGRLTTPEDVSRCLLALCDPGTSWMTGNTIRVDGGEDFVGSMPSSS
jgi:NAD(P)-dependent dehydrogenase (short-subunit alcohol dehydrogenase family)